MTPATLVCATLNARVAVELTFASLRRCTPEPVRVLVADNGSTDGTLEFLQSLGWLSVSPAAERRDRRTDHGSTLDWLVAQVDTEFVITIDSDVEFLEHGWLTRLLAYARELDASGLFEPAIGAYRGRLAPYLLLLRTEAFRSLRTSFQSFARIDDPIEAARWQARSPREELTLDEMRGYRTAAFYPTAACVFERLQEDGLRWAPLSPELEASFRHLGHMSWAQSEDRLEYARARLRAIEP